MPFRRLDATAAAQDRAVQEAATIIRAAGVVAFPTDTLYGLAADPFSGEAVGRLCSAKGRAAGHALPLVAADLAQVEAQIGALPALGVALARRFWPGPLTLLVAAPTALAAAVAAGTGLVGVRVPAHALARELCAACERVLTATSANRTGENATPDPDEVARALSARIDALLDGGRAPGGPASTIVDVSGAEARLIREGPISWAEVQACLGSA